MMRPQSFLFQEALPDPPSLATVALDGSNNAVIGWVDPTPVDYVTTTNFGNAQNEIGFNIWKSTGAGFSQIGTATANASQFIDTTPGSGTVSYAVSAYNAAGDSAKTSTGTLVLSSVISSPFNGDVWVQGQTYRIEWALNAGADNYRLHYYDADRTPHWIANVGNTNFFDWTVPTDAVAGGGKILRLRSFNGTNNIATDWSTGTFAIASPMYPNGGENFDKGMSYTLAWGQIAGADNYRLHYFDADNTPHSIANVGNTTTHSWMVPYDALAEAGKRFRVTAFNGTTKLPTTTLQFSAGTFAISSLMYPNGGETLNVNTNYFLTWAPVPGADSYNLVYFDADNTRHTIGKVSNATYLSWVVPPTAVIEAGKRFRVVPYSGTTQLTSNVQWSDGTFSIAP